MQNIHHANKQSPLVQLLQFPASTVQIITRRHIGPIALPTSRPVVTGLAMLGMFAVTRLPDFAAIGMYALIGAFLRWLVSIGERQKGVHHDPSSRGEPIVAEFLPNVSRPMIEIWLEPVVCGLFSIVAFFMGLWIAAGWLVFAAVALHVVAKANYQIGQAAQASPQSAESRLKQFEALRRSGHISEREYNIEREQILSEL